MMQLFIQPLDVWLFRDGRSFNAGSDHRAKSLFPPFPTVIQGALRSNQLALQNIPLDNKELIAGTVGTVDDLKDLVLRGPFVAAKKDGKITRYFPQPQDAVTVNSYKNFVEIKPASIPEAVPSTLRISEKEVPFLLGLQDTPRKAAGAVWLEKDALMQYLAGEPVRGVTDKCLFDTDARIGIAKDSVKGTTQEGMLFEVAFNAPKDGVGLLVEIDGYEWCEPGFLKLGGESRPAYYEPVAAEEKELIPVWKDKLPGRFKLYLTTPAYFEHGWKPLDWNIFFRGGRVELKAAALGRFITIGGFDQQTQYHKPARRYVPAGSVYYFECIDGKDAFFAENLINNAITDGNYEAQCGFGQTILKEW